MTSSLNGGYLVRNLHLFEEKYICRVCSGLLRDPVQLGCGHRICQTCVQSENNIVRCLECQEETIFSEVRSDKGFLKDMLKLDVNCASCEWIGNLRDYQEHLKQSHGQYKCSHCGEILNSLPLLEQHTEKLCLKILVNCVLHRFGCKEQILRCDLQKHYLLEQHQRTIILILSQYASQNIEATQASAMFDPRMKMETSDLSSKVTTASSTTVVTGRESDEEEHFFEMIDLLSGGIQTLGEELTCLQSESLQQSQVLETADQTLSAIKTSVEESSGGIGAMSANLTILQQELFSLRQRFEEQQVISYDGTLIWKIDKFQEKMNDAKSERQVSIYSAPFYSSPTGYKMRARLYLYGDGNARRTHMSLFFVIMRSPNDPILQFPFSYKVTFCLFDQSVQQRHIIDSFRPDTKSNSFQRPRSDMNIASGIPKFASLSIFQQSDNPYIKDDTMFIKVMVDFQNMAKAMLPYALSLNPALPMHAQQRMIQQETERRAQQSPSAIQTNAASNEGKVSGTQDNGSSAKLQ